MLTSTWWGGEERGRAASAQASPTLEAMWAEQGVLEALGRRVNRCAGWSEPAVPGGRDCVWERCGGTEDRGSSARLGHEAPETWWERGLIKRGLGSSLRDPRSPAEAEAGHPHGPCQFLWPPEWSGQGQGGRGFHRTGWQWSGEGARCVLGKRYLDSGRAAEETSELSNRTWDPGFGGHQEFRKVLRGVWGRHKFTLGYGAWGAHRTMEEMGQGH